MHRCDRSSRAKTTTFLLFILASAGILFSQARPASALPIPSGSPFWRITSPQGTLWLLGSMPYGGKQFFPLPPAVEDAFRDSSILGVETDFREDRNASVQYMFNEYGKLQDGVSVQDLMDPEDLATVSQAFEKAGMPLQVLSSFRPWVLWYLYPGLVLSEDEQANAHLFEQHFLHRAGTRHVYELEGTELVLRLLSDTPDRLMARVLGGTMRTMPSYRDSVRIYAENWSGISQSGLDAAIWGSVENEEIKSCLDDHILQRNKLISERLSRLLEHKGTCFIILDLKFLRGDGGLPAQLASLGYGIENIPLR